MTEKKIIIGADHGGFDLKQLLVDYLKSKSYQVEDIGTYDNKRCDYPDVAKTLCAKIVSGEYQKGILLCGTGIGISISANKVKGIRCALCHDHYTAKMCRNHNDANVLALGGRNTGPEVAKEIVDVFLGEKFDGDHHIQRIAKISELEKYI